MSLLGTDVRTAYAILAIWCWRSSGRCWAQYTVRRRQLKYGPSGGLGAGAVSKDYASVPRNKLGSAHPLDSKWQITPYLLYWVSNRIFWGAPSGRCSSRREWEPEAAKRVDAGASHPSPPLTWRIGMTAPVIKRAGAASIQMDIPASPIKMAPARSRAPGPSRVFHFKQPDGVVGTHQACH
jgi:hypothetical protein